MLDDFLKIKPFPGSDKGLCMKISYIMIFTPLGHNICVTSAIRDIR